jgi:ankyrin repeat protein
VKLLLKKYDYFFSKDTSFSEGMKGACSAGNKKGDHLEIIKLLNSYNKDLIKNNIAYVFEKGNLELAKTLMASYTFNFDTMLYGACLFSPKTGDPLKMIDFLMTFDEKVYDPNLALWYACKGQNEKVIKIMDQGKITDYDYIFSAAVLYGHYELVKKYIEKAKYSTYKIICDACMSGNIKVIKFLLAYDLKNDVKYANLYEEFPLIYNVYGAGLQYACKSNQYEAAKLMIEMGAAKKKFDFKACLRFACSHANIQLINLLLECGITVKEKYICDVLRFTKISLDIMKLLIKKISLDDKDFFEELFSYNCHSSEIAEFLIQYIDPKRCLFENLVYTVKEGNIKTFKLLYSYYDVKNGLNHFFKKACEGNYPKMVKFLMKLGPVDLRQGFLSACLSKNIEVFKLMLKSIELFSLEERKKIIANGAAIILKKDKSHFLKIITKSYELDANKILSYCDTFNLNIMKLLIKFNARI